MELEKQALGFAWWSSQDKNDEIAMGIGLARPLDEMKDSAQDLFLNIGKRSNS